MEQLYLYVALVGVALVLYGLTRTRSKSEPNQPTVAPIRPTSAPLSDDQELKEALEAFMNELETDNARLLDSFGKLQVEYKQTIAEQTRTIHDLEARLYQAEQKLTDTTAQLQVLQEQVDTLERGTTTDLLNAEEEAALQVTQFGGADVQAESTDMSEQEGANRSQDSPPPAFAFSDKYARVVELSQQGLEPEQIARETGIGLGEITLVLGLARREES
ncbi:MAG TPA: hypothetical protein VFV52_14915 [Bacilli bacterium]|nr:hypothetical protein [Bacilli bacterium]